MSDILIELEKLNNGINNVKIDYLCSGCGFENSCKSQIHFNFTFWNLHQYCFQNKKKDCDLLNIQTDKIVFIENTSINGPHSMHDKITGICNYLKQICNIFDILSYKNKVIIRFTPIINNGYINEDEFGNYFYNNMEDAKNTKNTNDKLESIKINNNKIDFTYYYGLKCDEHNFKEKIENYLNN
ncbi:MAG: hypothetical protein Ta2D_12600 [Rickettsiales bacterium]|nr:MAG: hypothetical protein Ta2D_12600 [Rickettsiales bacterium]